MAVKVAATIEPMASSFPVVAANNVSGLATVATTGDYNDLTNKPSNITNAEYAQKIGTISSHPAVGSSSLPVYVKNDGALSTITSLKFDDISITPRTGGGNTVHSTLPTSSWYDSIASYNFIGIDTWTCLIRFPSSLIEQTNSFRIDIENITYHLGQVLSMINIQDICPNATSLSIDKGVQLLDGNNHVLTGIGFIKYQASGYGDYFLVVDPVLNTGTTYPSIMEGVMVSYETINTVNNSQIATNTLQAKQIKDLSIIQAQRLSLLNEHNVPVQKYFKDELTDYTNYGYEFYAVLLPDLVFGATVNLSVQVGTYTGTWYAANSEGPGYNDIIGASTVFGQSDYCYFTSYMVIIKHATNGFYLVIESSLYNSLTVNDYVYYNSSSIDGVMLLKGQLIVDGIDSVEPADRGKITANKLVCNGTQIDSMVTSTTAHTVNLYSNADWTTNKNCWCLSPLIAAADTDNWTVNVATIVLWGYSCEVKLSDFTSGNLTDYCTNATSYADDLFAPIYYDSTQIDGACVSKATNGAYYLWLDTTEYPGASIQDVLVFGDLFTSRELTIVTPSKITTQKLQVGGTSNITITDSTIIIGNTSLNEAQLQALLALINGGGKSPTLGIMNIVE